MGLFDGLIKLTQPYDEDDGGSFAGARDDEEEFKTPAQMNRERERSKIDFQHSFGSIGSAAPEKAEDDVPEEEAAGGTSLLGNLKFKPKQANKPKPFKGNASGDLHVFAPTTLKEMLGLKEYLENRVSVILKLDGLSDGMDRRLLDFASGMAYGLDGKLSPISGKTYLVSPQSVNLIQNNGASQNNIETDARFY